MTFYCLFSTYSADRMDAWRVPNEVSSNTFDKKATSYS